MQKVKWAVLLFSLIFAVRYALNCVDADLTGTAGVFQATKCRAWGNYAVFGVAFFFVVLVYGIAKEKVSSYIASRKNKGEYNK